MPVGWEIVLQIVANCLNNEKDASGTTPSYRVFGRDTSRLKSALSDTPTSSSVSHEFLERAERIRKVYQQAKADRRLHRLLVAQSLGGTTDEIYESRTLGAIWRERSGARQLAYQGFNSGIQFREPVPCGPRRFRSHVRLWPEQTSELGGVETRPDPRALGGLQVPGHPADEVEPTADELPPIMSDRAQTALGDAPGRCLRSVPKAVGKRTACWKNLSQTWPRARFPTSHI